MVFWLPDRPNPCAFPRVTVQWLEQVSSPVTAAGPRRIRTVFPYTEQKSSICLFPSLSNVRRLSRKYKKKVGKIDEGGGDGWNDSKNRYFINV